LRWRATCHRRLSGIKRNESFNRRKVVLWGEVSIPHRHLDGLVPHQFGHGANINPCHYQAACKRMPQAIPSEISQARFSHCPIEPMFVALELYTFQVHEYRGTARRTLGQYLECSYRF